MVKTDEIRIAIIAIVIEDKSKSNTVNAILHDYSDLFVGRMGIPFKEKKISVITLIAQGTNDNISALTGKLGRVEGITVNSMLTKKSKKWFFSEVWKYRGIETTTIEEWKSGCIDVWKVVGCTQRVFKFFLDY